MRAPTRKIIPSRLLISQLIGKYQHRAAAEAMSGSYFRFKMYPELMKKSPGIAYWGKKRQNLLHATGQFKVRNFRSCILRDEKGRN